MIKLNSINEQFDYLNSCRELVGVFELYLEGRTPHTLSVKIWRDNENSYIPEMSHHYQAERAAGPHIPSFHYKSSKEKALLEVLQHGLILYNADDINSKWIENDNF